MDNTQVGVPVYGSQKKKTWRLKDGSNIYRILPPFASFAKEGRWAIFESIHWGYKGGKGIRTFNCILQKDFKSKMVKVPCAECDLIDSRKKDYENQLKQLVEVEKKMTKEQAKEFLKPLSTWLYEHNLDKKWYVNAMNRNGEIGRLAIPHKMYQALNAEIGELMKKKIDPLAVNQGVEFDFFRSGQSNQTIHKCKAVTESIDVPGVGSVEKIKLCPLTEEIVKRMATEAWDLKGMFRTIKGDEITRLVASGGDPEVVDSIFGGGDTENEEPSPEELAASSGATNLAETVAAPKAEPKAENKPAEVDEIAALKAKLAAMEAAQKPVTSETKPVEPSSASPASMSNDEFMKKFGKK